MGFSENYSWRRFVIDFAANLLSFPFQKSTKIDFSVPTLDRFASIFSVPGAPKIYIFCPQTTKNQYFLFPGHQRLIFFIPEHQNPTSPLGLGGLAWGVCFQPLFFQPFWFQPSGEGFTPPPTPALKCPPLGVCFVFKNHCFEGIAGQVSWRPLGAVWDPCGLQNRVWMAKNRINFQSKINASLNRFLERFLIYWGVFGTTFSYRFLWVWKAKLGGQTEPGEGQNTS